MGRVSLPPHGSPEWWAALKSGMTDEERALTSIGLLDLSNGRTFKFNGRIEQIARDELAKGVPWEDIVAAARYVGNTIEERDRMPSLTPEKK